MELPKGMRDLVVLSDMLGNLVVKTDFILSCKDILELQKDVERWKSDGDDPAADRFIDSFKELLDDRYKEQVAYERI